MFSDLRSRIKSFFIADTRLALTGRLWPISLVQTQAAPPVR